MQATVLPSSTTEHATYRSDTEELTGGELTEEETALLGVFKARISYTEAKRQGMHTN